MLAAIKPFTSLIMLILALGGVAATLQANIYEVDRKASNNAAEFASYLQGYAEYRDAHKALHSDNRAWQRRADDKLDNILQRLPKEK